MAAIYSMKISEKIKLKVLKSLLMKITNFYIFIVVVRSVCSQNLLVQILKIKFKKNVINGYIIYYY